MTREERKEALDVLTDMANALNLIPTTRQGKVFKMVLQELQKPEQKWIPVSERLPKPYTWVYATCHSLVDDRPNWVVDTIYDPSLSRFSISDWGNIPMLNVKDAEVIAWMEWIEPEPYKAESEG